MLIELARVAGDELILKTKDLPAIRKFAYNFKKGDYEIKRGYKGRSGEANRYCWALCGMIADAINSTKEEVYRKNIREVGIFQDDEVEPDKVEWRCKAWEQIGTGWLTERVDFTADGNKEIIRFYYGSSRYNTKQMARLIESIIDDAKSVGIEVISESEKALLLEDWERGKKNENTAK